MHQRRVQVQGTKAVGRCSGPFLSEREDFGHGLGVTLLDGSDSSFHR
jgi:hypothetical protein